MSPHAAAPLPAADVSRICTPGPRARTVRTETGTILEVPAGWALLAPGDAGLTRRVKAAGPTWTVQEKRGRKIFSRGIWAPTANIETHRAALEVERSTESYAKKREASVKRRERVQTAYVETFRDSVLRFLAFDSCHETIALKLADAVTTHATPVGSGTVARTERIPVDERAESAVIAWMRHQTTAYEHMTIPRIKGKRREIRRMLAERSRSLLMKYRSGQPVVSDACPLQRALTKLQPAHPV